MSSRIQMLNRSRCLIILLIILTACSPVNFVELGTPKCNLNAAIDINAAEFRKDGLVFRAKGQNFKAFNLSSNEFTCDFPQSSDYLHRYEDAAAQKIYSDALILSEGSRKIELFSKKYSGKTFEKAAEDFCKSIKFDFMFGLSTEKGPVVGCQISKDATSAVMIKQDTNTPGNLRIAALKLYSPILAE